LQEEPFNKSDWRYQFNNKLKNLEKDLIFNSVNQNDFIFACELTENYCKHCEDKKKLIDLCTSAACDIRVNFPVIKSICPTACWTFS
jgi:hypothetical protein